MQGVGYAGCRLCRVEVMQGGVMEDVGHIGYRGYVGYGGNVSYL
jgi:hypothetical protein